MSTLRSALDELQGSDLRFLSDDRLVDDLDEVERTVRVLESQRARLLAEVERRGAFGADGHLSMSAWMADRWRTGHGEAAARVRVARALERLPAVAEAAAAGELSSAAVAMLVRAHESCPEAFRSVEEPLVEAARTLTVGALRGVLAHWRQAADPAGALAEEEDAFERRRLHVSPTLDGTVRVDGDLDPETGQVVMTALRAAIDAEVKAGRDRRTPAQRRADALGQVCLAWLDRADRPTVGSERPHVVVTMDAAALGGEQAGGPSSPTRARSRRSRPGDGRATPWSRACSPGRARCRSSSAGRPRWCRRRSVEPWWSGTAGAGSPGATGHRGGATPTTCATGPTVARPGCRTWCCCAGRTTGSSTRGGSAWRWSRARRRSRDRTARRSRTGRRRSGGSLRPACRHRRRDGAPTARARSAARRRRSGGGPIPSTVVGRPRPARRRAGPFRPTAG